MKLIKFTEKNDYGTDYHIQFLNMKHWSLFQISVGWSNYPAYPHLQVSSGCGRLFSLIFWCYKFALDFEILGHTWRI